ncbi:MAG: hypothetical protein BWY27_00057 [Bacteroidetes bacterium ADurb.Bin234]|nr:MAG: hypothetical protein BWY27_00057 [Bacteroidetes bacterium ADurb.Bin234]
MLIIKKTKKGTLTDFINFKKNNMKTYKIIIASAFVVAIGIGIFFACDKDLKQVEKNNNKLVQKDNPEEYNIRALFTDDTAIDIIFYRDNGNISITYTLSPAQPEDMYKIIVIDPNNDFPLTYNEDSSMVMGLNPNDNKNYVGWYFHRGPEPGNPIGPGVVTPTDIHVTAECYGCVEPGECQIDYVELPLEGKKETRCINQCSTCYLSGSTYTSSTPPDEFENILSSMLIFEVNPNSTFTINDDLLVPGSSYTIQ